MSKHTPGKWKVIGCGGLDCWCRVIVTDAGMPVNEGLSVVSAGAVFADDAERIVRCVNAHDDLLAALKELLAAVQRSVCENSGPAQEAAHIAIARAEGKT